MDRSSDSWDWAADSSWRLLDSAEFDRAQELAAATRNREELEKAGAQAMARAALLVSGEVGFAQMTVADLLDRSGSNRDRFYRTFRDKAHCFAVGYEAATEELCEKLLSACRREARWPAAMHAALLDLNAFLVSEPSLARGLIVEAPHAGEAVMRKRREIFERLSRTVDRARLESDDLVGSPPEITADFVIGGAHAEVLRTLRNGVAFADLVPDILYLSVLFYFGDAAARAEVRRLT